MFDKQIKKSLLLVEKYTMQLKYHNENINIILWE